MAFPLAGTLLAISTAKQWHEPKQNGSRFTLIENFGK
jgi:hypothetical protein